MAFSVLMFYSLTCIVFFADSRHRDNCHFSCCGYPDFVSLYRCRHEQAVRMRVVFTAKLI